MNNHRFITGRSLPLLGIGTLAAGAMGLYMYRSPRLRKKIRNADTVREAATLITKQVRDDSADMADTMKHTMKGGVSKRLRRTRNFLGSRFLRLKRSAERKTPAKVAARHAKHEAKHMARTAKADARHASEHANIEAQHMMNEMKEAKDLAMNRAANR